MIDEIVKKITSISGTYSGYEIFSDWIKAFALSISNSTDILQGKIWQDTGCTWCGFYERGVGCETNWTVLHAVPHIIINSTNHNSGRCKRRKPVYYQRAINRRWWHDNRGRKSTERQRC